MAEQKRVDKKRITDAQQKQFDEIVPRIQAAAQELIDENPLLRKKLVAAGLLVDETVEDCDVKGD